MKPSERIGDLAKEILADVERRASPANFEVHRHEYANAALSRAIVQYLDERDDERERERRGFAAVLAMALVRSNGPVELAKKYVVLAGLPEFLVFEGLMIDQVVEDIARGAREAGIL
jgi:hypothetical protein